MSTIIVFAETANGKFRKASLEAVSYAYAVSQLLGSSVKAIAFNATSAEELYKYGASKVVNVTSEVLKTFDPTTYAKAIAKLIDSDIVIIPHTNNGGSLAGLLAIESNGALITNALEIPSSVSPFVVKRKSFSSKGIMQVEAGDGLKLITILQGSYGIKENQVEGSVEVISIDELSTKLITEEMLAANEKIDLKEADLVVSAGRGMKGPENWGMIEELANLIGAATACSKPCSDIGWRPHSEHVGQTGKAISPSLYIAVGISGAIQHLAGVGSSNTIVVINSDPEAPFFKAADYGVVGDAFDIVPKLISEIKALNA
ncbi:MAG: electron transfer flavoprotein subunit alpha/FixB family protein [Solirubrobacteraceae bacterium]